MTEPTEVFLGFDPGGRAGIGRFGWSICRAEAGQLQVCATGRGQYAGQVVERVTNALPANSRVLAIGIDAPMFWNITGEERNVDAIIEDAVKKAAKSLCLGDPKSHGRKNPGVQKINQLRGACLVQGILLGDSIYKQFKVPITEVHPGALSWLKPVTFDYIQKLTVGKGKSEHERDATLAAYAAWCMHQQAPGWHDLVKGEFDKEEPAYVIPLLPRAC